MDNRFDGGNMAYYFLDYNENTMKNLYIKGNDYTDLIELCFKYSQKFSFVFSSLKQVEWLNQKSDIYNYDEIRLSDKIRNYKVYCECTNENKKILLSNWDNLFNCLDHTNNNYEDITFYREDESVFFWSETHEGVCAIFNRANENVDEVTSKEGWDTYKPSEANFWIPKNLICGD